MTQKRKERRAGYANIPQPGLGSRRNSEGELHFAQPFATIRIVDPKDAPILAAAIVQQCQYLVTLNEKDFWPQTRVITVLRPGRMLQEIRRRLYTESQQ